MAFGSFCSPHKPMDPPARYLEMFAPETDEELLAGPHALIIDGKAPAPKDLERIRRKRRAYKAQIAFIDGLVGKALSCLEAEGMMDETVILFTSDHGDMLGDHNRLNKQNMNRAFPYNELAVRFTTRTEFDRMLNLSWPGAR